MTKEIALFALHAGEGESTMNRNTMHAPTVALTVGYHKRNQKKIRRMRRQGLKV